MTITTHVRINWPVAAERLLDDATIFVGGDPKTVVRQRFVPGDIRFPELPQWDDIVDRFIVRNRMGQGLRSALEVSWQEAVDVGYDDWPMPPALVILMMDNPYGRVGDSGIEFQRNALLPMVRDWLDGEDVPRDRWWWEDEGWGYFFSGTVDVSFLGQCEDVHEYRWLTSETVDDRMIT